jgi:hypothetical protein
MYSDISLLGVSAELLHHVSSRWVNFHEIWYLSIFFNICQEKSSFIKIWQE